MRWAVASVVMTGLLTASCSGQSNSAEFCDVSLSSSGRVSFDIDNRLVSATDTSSEFVFEDAGSYYGITIPFPLMVPAEEMMEGGQASWDHGDYHYEARQGSVGSEWLLVEGQQAQFTAGIVPSRTRMLLVYSRETGLIAYSREVRTENERFFEEYVACRGQLRLESLRASQE